MARRGRVVGGGVGIGVLVGASPPHTSHAYSGVSASTAARERKGREEGERGMRDKRGEREG